MSSRDFQTEFLDAYQEYADAIFRHCYFRVFDRERANDLMQETFTRAWEYIIKGNKVRNVKALLYTIATNLIIDEARKRKTDSLDALMEKGFDPPSLDCLSFERQAETQEIIQYLKSLDPIYQDVLVMRYIDDLAIKDIAKVLGVSQTVVSVRIYRGLQKLRKHLHVEQKKALFPV